ncbi:MAG: Rap1a/Tai family immunity protein [Methylococcaceae bacterium]
MRKVSLLITILFCILYVNRVQAGFWDGAKLFNHIQRDTLSIDGYDTNVGVSYIMGVFDVNTGKLFCPLDGEPSKQLTELGKKILTPVTGVSIKQVTQMVFNYMHKHPALLREPADKSVINALKEVYPCK